MELNKHLSTNVLSSPLKGLRGEFREISDKCQINFANSIHPKVQSQSTLNRIVESIDWMR